MAIVEMDLAEFQAKEELIKKLKGTILEFEKHQKQVLVKHQDFDGEIKVIDSNPAFEVTGIRYGYSVINNSNNYGRESEKVNFQTLLNNGIIEIKLTQNKEKTSSEYVNLTEIEDQIKEQVEQQFKDKIDQWKAKADDVKSQLVLQADQNEARIKKLMLAHEIKIGELKTATKEVGEEAENQIEALKLQHKIELSNQMTKKDNEIKKLKEGKSVDEINSVIATTEKLKQRNSEIADLNIKIVELEEQLKYKEKNKKKSWFK